MRLYAFVKRSAHRMAPNRATHVSGRRRPPAPHLWTCKPVIAKRFLMTAVALSALTSAGAASAQTTGGAPASQAISPGRPAAASYASAGVDDPYESTNRKLYDFNQVLDRNLVRPGIVFYHHATPTPVRLGLHNVLVNATHPVIIINDILQLRPVRALNALGRFAINSTVGVGGVFDVAGNDFPYQSADFGLTMARYGVPTGPYLFLPVLGPTTLRDGAGRIVDGVIDPLNSVNYTGRNILAPARAVLGGVDARDRLDPVIKYVNRTATDPYATIRSAYFQNREAEVRGSVTSSANLQALPDFGPTPSGSAAPYAMPRSSTPPSGRDAGPAPSATEPAPGPSAAAQSTDPVGDLLAALPAGENLDAADSVSVAALD